VVRYSSGSLSLTYDTHRGQTSMFATLLSNRRGVLCGYKPMADDRGKNKVIPSLMLSLDKECYEIIQLGVSYIIRMLQMMAILDCSFFVFQSYKCDFSK